MSKAYDSVNLQLLSRALSRIQMPTHLINILTDLLTNRSNQVITNFGLTDPYKVQNGIDQGETITPLLWRIYYDPLITKISTEFTGYNMSVSWRTDISTNQFNKKQAHLSVLAYMDDTMWLASSKEQLELITQTAETFFQMASIQVNPNKSTLITNNINNSESQQINFLNQAIKAQSSKSAFKFLGCWFTINNKHKLQIKLLNDEIFHLTNTLKSKHITDKQICYIINTVILPIVEYRIQNIVLPQHECQKILSRYLTIAKHKSNLSRSTPNSTMLNHNIYNIKNIWDIQLQHHIPKFLNRLNNTEHLGATTHIRLQQLQNNLWSTTNILQHSNPLIDGFNKHTTNFKIIKLLSHFQFTISNNLNTTQPYTFLNPYTPLENILNKHINYLTFKKQLRTKKIIFLEQLTSSSNDILLDWKHISTRLNYIPTGCKPLWFTILEKLITSDQVHRQIADQYKPHSNNSLSYSTGHYYTKLKPWLLTYINNNIIIGKARRFNKLLNTISITHWNIDCDNSITDLYPYSQPTCTLCPGCHLNSNRISNYCTFNISATLSTKFLGRKISSNTPNKLNFHANHLDLIYSVALCNPINIPPLPTITIKELQIPPIFTKNLASENLQLILNKNNNSQNFTFYTDGSAGNITTEQCSMGIGWVQIQDSDILHTYQAKIQYWPSAYKAELMSILSVICVCPRNSTINIYTDSQSIISKFNKLTTTHPNPNKVSSFNYWPIWQTLLHLIKSLKHKLNFHKVQAHSDNIFNNSADTLAKDHLYSPLLEFQQNNIYNPFYSISFLGYPIEQSIRRSIKNICNAHNIAMWSSQNRVQDIVSLSEYIDWNATWLFLNNNQKRSNNFTNFQLSHSKSFRIKNLLSDLPTLNHFHQINPTIYPHQNCFSCNIPETELHWLYCSYNTSITLIIKTSIQEIITSSSLDISTPQLQELHNKLFTHQTLQQSQYLDNSISIISTLRGFVPYTLIQTISYYSSSNKEATNLTIKLLLHISNSIYNQIWKPYCQKFAEWKNNNNIPKQLPHIQSNNNSRTYTKHDYTYNCICGLPDQLHIGRENKCPPLGLALQKTKIWSDMWIKYSAPTNSIFNIQI
jgi:ribonuclease HI